jgi:hypothetical protein
MKLTLTLTQQNELCDAVTNGATIELAAAVVGCTENVIRNTVEIDLDFRRRLEMAEGEMTTRYLEGLLKAVRENGDPRAAARWLEYVESNRDPIGDFMDGVIDSWHKIKPILDERTRKKLGRQVDRMIDTLFPEDVQRPWKPSFPKQP